jgi:hypothetical protein
MEFYTVVLLELMAALGAALAVGNAIALVRRRRPLDSHAAQQSTETSTSSTTTTSTTATLTRAPLVRTLAYLALGIVVCVWSLATLIA